MELAALLIAVSGLAVAVIVERKRLSEFFKGLGRAQRSAASDADTHESIGDAAAQASHSHRSATAVDSQHSLPPATRTSLPAGDQLFDYSVFISYAHEDSVFVDALCSRLDNHQVTYWRDVHDLRPGQSIGQAIDQAILRSRYAVLIVSPPFMRSLPAAREMYSFIQRQAEGARDTVIPVWLDAGADEVAAFSPQLADVWAVDGADGPDKVADSIVVHIRSSDASESPVDGPSTRPLAQVMWDEIVEIHQAASVLVDVYKSEESMLGLEDRAHDVAASIGQFRDRYDHARIRLAPATCAAIDTFINAVGEAINLRMRAHSINDAELWMTSWEKLRDDAGRARTAVEDALRTELSGASTSQSMPHLEIREPTPRETPDERVAVYGRGARAGRKILVINWLLGSKCWLQPGHADPDDDGAWVFEHSVLSSTTKRRIVYALAVSPQDVDTVERLFDDTVATIPDLEELLTAQALDYQLSTGWEIRRVGATEPSSKGVTERDKITSEEAQLLLAAHLPTRARANSDTVHYFVTDLIVHGVETRGALADALQKWLPMAVALERAVIDAGVEPITSFNDVGIARLVLMFASEKYARRYPNYAPFITDALSRDFEGS